VASGWTALAEDLADHPAADAVSGGDLGQAHAALTIADYSIAVDVEGPAPDVSPLEFGAPHAGSHPLDDQVAFEFGDGADDDDERPAERTAGVDVLAEANELDLQMGEFIEHLEEVADRPCHAVERPDHHDIEPAATSVCQQLIEAGALCFRTADLVGVLVDDLEATLRGEAAQIVQLGFGVLIDSRHAHVKGRTFHPRRPFFRPDGRPFG